MTIVYHTSKKLSLQKSTGQFRMFTGMFLLHWEAPESCKKLRRYRQQKKIGNLKTSLCVPFVWGLYCNTDSEFQWQNCTRKYSQLSHKKKNQQSISRDVVEFLQLRSDAWYIALYKRKYWGMAFILKGNFETGRFTDIFYVGTPIDHSSRLTDCRTRFLCSWFASSCYSASLYRGSHFVVHCSWCSRSGEMKCGIKSDFASFQIQYW